MLESKNTITEVKNAFYGLISRPVTSEKRISASLRICQQKLQKWKNKRENSLGRGEGTKYPRTVGRLSTIKNRYIMSARKRRGERERHGVGQGRTKDTREATVMENFSQVNVRHQAIDPGSSEKTEQDKNQRCDKNYTQAYHLHTAENET